MEPEFHKRRSITLPLAVILLGVFFQLQAAGLFGSGANSFLSKFWPVVILAAGLDLFLERRRILSSIVLCLLGAALIIYNLTGGTQLWEIFLTFWPILLMLYGLDMLLNGRSLSAVLILIALAAVAVIVFLVGKNSLDLGKLPVQLNVDGISETLSSLGKTGAVPAKKSQKISYQQPGSPMAVFQVSAPSGQIRVKSAVLDGLVMSGTVSLSNGEILNERFEQGDSSATYVLTGTPGAQSGSSSALWDLQISQKQSVTLMTAMNDGYQMIDMRGLTVNEVTIINNSGDIDVMLPFNAAVPVNISTQKGSIRIFVPENVSAYVTVRESSGMVYPENYAQNGAQIFPIAQADGSSQVTVNANAPAGQVKVILNRN